MAYVKPPNAYQDGMSCGVKTFHLHAAHMTAMQRRGKVGRSLSATLRTLLYRYLHLMSVGREQLEAKGLDDEAIQTLAEALKWANLSDVFATLQIPETLAKANLPEGMLETIGTLSDQELIALADSVELMFARYKI